MAQRVHARPIIYLSGAMHGSKARPDDRDMALETAKLYSRVLWLYGYAVFSPQCNTTHMYGSGLYSDPFLAFDLEFISEMADAVLALPGWEHSDGACAEVELARAIGLPIYTTLQEAYDALPH